MSPLTITPMLLLVVIYLSSFPVCDPDGFSSSKHHASNTCLDGWAKGAWLSPVTLLFPSVWTSVLTRAVLSASLTPVVVDQPVTILTVLPQGWSLPFESDRALPGLPWACRSCASGSCSSFRARQPLQSTPVVLVQWGIKHSLASLTFSSRYG